LPTPNQRRRHSGAADEDFNAIHALAADALRYAAPARYLTARRSMPPPPPLVAA